MTKALALALALISSALAAAPASLTVWLPEQAQTATLSAAGLVAADGRRVVLNQTEADARPEAVLPLERPIAGGFARFIPAGTISPARLEVVRGGRVTASRTFPEVRRSAGLQGTGRGPCLSYVAAGSQEATTRCFAPDLKTEWASLPGSPFVSSDGQVVYQVKTDWKLEKPAGDDVAVVRRDLGTGQEVNLSYRVPLPGQTLVVPPDMVDPLDRRATLRIAAELPGEHYLVCASTTIPKDPCRLDVVDRDFKKLLSLQGHAGTGLPQATKDGRKVFYLGNTLQVWDVQTGKRLVSLHDPQWAVPRQDGQGEYPLKAYLTPDATQAAILTYRFDPRTGPDFNHLNAYLYRLSDGKSLGHFAVKP